MILFFSFCIKININNIDLDTNTEKHQDHTWSYGMKITSVDERYSKPYQTYFGEDEITFKITRDYE